MYLLDTNAVINYLDASMPPKAMLFMNVVVDNQCNISVITKMEALGYGFKSPAEQKTMWAFITDSAIFNLNDDIVNRTISIRVIKKLKLPDAIIAATAIENGFTLVTRNISDFNGIFGLQVINPWDI